MEKCGVDVCAYILMDFIPTILYTIHIQLYMYVKIISFRSAQSYAKTLNVFGFLLQFFCVAMYYEIISFGLATVHVQYVLMHF